jgi:hypothetical protein
MSCSETVVDFDLSTSVANSTQTNVYACADLCSVSRMCFVAVFNRTDGNCMWSNNQPASFTFRQAADLDVAVVDPVSQLKVGYDTACLYGNLTTVTIYNGMQALIYCGLDVLAPDYCPQGNSSCPSHATSPQQCLDICSESHPLCWAVAYDPTLITGYANCYLKDTMPTTNEFRLTGSLNTAEYNGAILHAALVTVKNGTSIPIECTDLAEVTAKDGQTFILSCNSYQLGNDLWVLHEDSLQSCIDGCVTWDNGTCVGVVYDAQLGNGWENCYLKNATTLTTYSTSMTLALAGSRSGSTPGNSSSTGGSTGSSTGGSKGGSKAWIAGPVVGGLVALVAVAYAVFWCRKRSTSSSGSGRWEKGPQPRVEVGGKIPRWELEGREQQYPGEMEGRGQQHPGEMPG